VTILVDARFDDYPDIGGASAGHTGTGFAPIWLIQTPGFLPSGSNGDGAIYPSGSGIDPATGLQHASLVADPAGSGKTVAKFILDPNQTLLTGGYLRSECTFHTGNNNDNNQANADMPNASSSVYWYWYSFYMPTDWDPGAPLVLMQLHDLDDASASVIAYAFTVSGVTVSPGIGSTWTNNGRTYTVTYVKITAGAGTVVATSNGAPQASGTLTKSSGTGDATIAFSASVLSMAQASVDPSLILTTCDHASYLDFSRLNKLSFRQAVSTVDEQIPTLLANMERRYPHVMTSLPLGRWVEVVVNYHAHIADAVGKTVIWIDRRKVYQESRRNSYSNQYGVSLHIGLYGYWGAANLARTTLYSKGAVIGDKNHANFNAFMTACGWPLKTELEFAANGTIRGAA